MIQKQRIVSQRRLSYVLTRELRKSQDRLFVAPPWNESLRTIVHAERLENGSRSWVGYLIVSAKQACQHDQTALSSQASQENNKPAKRLEP